LISSVNALKRFLKDESLYKDAAYLSFEIPIGTEAYPEGVIVLD